MRSLPAYSRLAASSMIALLWATGQPVLAHTTIRDVVSEGVNSYNAVMIGHGCLDEKTGARIPVTANSVTFPTVNPEIQKVDAKGSVIGTTTLASEFQYKFHDGSIRTLNSVAEQLRVIADKNVFSKTVAKTDANGNTTGWYSTGGALATNQYGLLPFRFGAVSFNKDSCAKSLKIKIAIADVCSPLGEAVNFPRGRADIEQRLRTAGREEQENILEAARNAQPRLVGNIQVEDLARKPKLTRVARAIELMVQQAEKKGELMVFPPKKGTANTWIPNTTSVFSDPGLDGVGTGTKKGYPATLTINRNTTANPLAASCNGGYDVVAWPSDADVNQNLPFPGWGK